MYAETDPMTTSKVEDISCVQQKDMTAEGKDTK